MTSDIPDHARESHATLADYHRTEAGELLAQSEGTDSDISARATAAALLALEARLADLCDTLAASYGGPIDDGEVAAW